MREAACDVFISYASEDREEVVEPLVRILTRFGLRVWYDQDRLRVGQRLSHEIDQGLQRCRYGIVILSPSFLPKHHPNRELDGLLQREVDGEQVILPVWHRIDEREIRRFSPPLAGRKAARTSDGLVSVAVQLLEVIQPTLPEELLKAARSREFVQLPEIARGNQLLNLIWRAHAYNFANDELDDDAEAERIGGFLQLLHDWGEASDDLEPSERLRLERELSKALKELRERGWRAFGKQVDQAPPGEEGSFRWSVATLLLTRAPVLRVLVDAKGQVIAETPPGTGSDH